MKLYMKELNNEENEIMSLLKGIPEEDIDHHETDLYLRKTPEVTAKVINKLPDTYKKNVTTFIDNIDHVTWYEIPFVFPRGKRRKHIEEESKQYSKKKLMITESLDEWDVKKIASMIEDCLYDRNFIVDRRKIWGKDIDFTVSYKYDDSHDSFTVRTKDFENLPEDEWFDLARAKTEEIAEAVLNYDSIYESTNINESKTLPFDFTGLGKIEIPTTTIFPTGKQIWNIGSHNPYIEDGYIIVCNTRDYKVIPETLEFVYVGKDNAKALHKVAGRRTIDYKNYEDFLVTEID